MTDDSFHRHFRQTGQAAAGEMVVYTMTMSISDLKTLRKAVIERVLEGDGKASNAQRRAAFDNSGLATPLSTLIDKVAKYSYKVSDEDIAAVKASGLDEDQIFELVICAAIGQANRQYETAFAALNAATKQEGGAHASEDSQ